MPIYKTYVTKLQPDTEKFFYEFHIERREDIIDGDTLDINIDAGFGITIRERIRVHGIDTPELTSKQGQQVRDIAQRLLWQDRTDNRFFIRTSKKNLKNQAGLMSFANDVKKGKFGRYLGEIFILRPNGKVWNYNQTLLDSGLAKAYHGGKKK